MPGVRDHRQNPSEWLRGQRLTAKFNTADRCCASIELNWWEVWTPENTDPDGTSSGWSGVHRRRHEPASSMRTRPRPVPTSPAALEPRGASCGTGTHRCSRIRRSRRSWPSTTASTGRSVVAPRTGLLSTAQARPVGAPFRERMAVGLMPYGEITRVPLRDAYAARACRYARCARRIERRRVRRSAGCSAAPRTTSTSGVGGSARTSGRG